MTNPAPQLPAWLPHDPRGDRPAAPQDRDPRIGTAIANGAGFASVALGPVPPASVWLIDYITVTAASAAESSLNLYDDPQAPAESLIDGTTNGNSAIAPYQPARRLLGSRSLVAVWTGCTPGARCTIRLEYREQRQA